MSGRSPFRRLFGPDPRGDVEEELSFHLEMRVRELIAAGETPERARELALLRFGDYDGSRSECVAIDGRRSRRYSRGRFVAELRQDVAYAWRSLLRARSFTAVAVLTLALGIGASSSIFSVVNAVLLRPLPFRDASSLYKVKTMYPDGTGYSLSAPDFMSVVEENRVFDGLAAFTIGARPLTGRGDPRDVERALVSRGAFEVLGLRTALGRSFQPAEHEPGGTDVAVLAHGFWQQEFGGSRDALGAVVEIAGVRYRVIGVLAADAYVAPGVQLYLPLAYGESFSAAASQQRRNEFLQVIGRLRAGVTPAAAAADMRRIGDDLRVRFPETNERLSLDVFSWRDEIVGGVRVPLLVLLGAVAMVMLIACVNVANLLLARGSARRGELALRAALGAGRGRLVRQLGTESGVLALLGGGAGLALAWGATRLLSRAPLADIPRLNETTIDGRVLLFTLASALLAAALFGTAPVLHATQQRIAPVLRAGGRGTVGGSGQRLRSGLIVVEMALAVMLLMGAGLLIRSFVELTRVDPGFRTQQAVGFRLSLQGPRYAEDAQLGSFISTLLEQLEALPDVRAAGASSKLPLTGLGAIFGPFEVEGGGPVPADVNSEIVVASVTPGYLTAVGATLLRGRHFTAAADRFDAPPTAILNQAAVRRWFGGENPVGQRVLLGGEPFEVVGVVGDILQQTPSTPVAPQLFMPYERWTARTMNVVLRTGADPALLAPRVRATVHALDPDLPVSDYAALEALVDGAVAAPRFYTSLLTLFAGIALALAGIGTFGVMSYTVAQRTREISLRLVLGARTGQVLLLIVGRAVALALLGLVLGSAAALALTRVLQSQLFGVSALDPVALGGTFLVLLGSAVLAGLLPARRAAALDPGLALREG